MSVKDESWWWVLSWSYLLGGQGECVWLLSSPVNIFLLEAHISSHSERRRCHYTDIGCMTRTVWFGGFCTEWRGSLGNNTCFDMYERIHSEKAFVSVLFSLHTKCPSFVFIWTPKLNINKQPCVFTWSHSTTLDPFVDVRPNHAPLHQLPLQSVKHRPNQTIRDRRC